MANFKRPWNAGLVAKGFAADTPPSTHELTWAAGVYEGEGSCNIGICGRGRRNGTYQRISVRVAQKDSWLCHKLRSHFGGTVRQFTTKANSLKNPDLMREYNCWDIYGSRALGFLQTIYQFLSPRRQGQIRVVLDAVRRSN